MAPPLSFFLQLKCNDITASEQFFSIFGQDFDYNHLTGLVYVQLLGEPHAIVPLQHKGIVIVHNYYLIPLMLSQQPHINTIQYINMIRPRNADWVLTI